MGSKEVKMSKYMPEIWHSPLMFLMSGDEHTVLSTFPSPGVNKRGGVNAVMSWQYWPG